MMYMKKNILPISILLSGILISTSIYYELGLDVLQKLFSIVGSLSIVVALGGYFYKKQPLIDGRTTQNQPDY